MTEPPKKPTPPVVETHKKPHLTVADAAELFQTYNQGQHGNDVLVIERKMLGGSVGGLPAIHITGAFRGSDWNAGRVFLRTEVPVHDAGEAFEKERVDARAAYEALGWLALTIEDTRLSSDQKVVQMRRLVQRWRDKTATKPEAGAKA